MDDNITELAAEFLRDLKLEGSDSGVFSLHGLKTGSNSRAVPNSEFNRTIPTKKETTAAKYALAATHGVTGEVTPHSDMKSARMAVGGVKGSYVTHTATGKIIDRVK